MPIDTAGKTLIEERLGLRPKRSQRSVDDEARRIIAQRNGLRDAVVYTPSQAKAEADTVNAIITQMYQDAVASPKIPQSYRNSFYAFCNEWVAFYQNHTSWLDRLWFANVDKISDYRKRAVTWRQLLSKHGFKPTTPEDTVPTSGIPWKWILLGGLGLVSVVVVVRLVRTTMLGRIALGEAEEAAMAIADAERRKRSARKVFSIA